MSLQLLSIFGIVFIWGLAIGMMFVMEKIAPNMEGYPIYAVIVATLFTISMLPAFF